MSLGDRLLLAFEALTRRFTHELPRAFVWSYSVEEATESSFTGRRLSPDCPFDDMPEIPLMPGIAGAGVKPARGSIALVAFVDGDPAKPRVVGWDQQVPVSITVDASEKIRVGPSVASVEVAGGGPAVHRVNDTGSAGSFAVVLGIPTYFNPDGVPQWSLSGTVGGTPVVFVITPIATNGTLSTKATTGSSKVTCG